MAKHEHNFIESKDDFINKLMDMPLRRDKFPPELAGVALLLIVSMILGIRAWLLL